MKKLFEDGHAVQRNHMRLINNPGKTCYHSHFCIKTSKKFCVVFDCTARHLNVNLNDFLYKGPVVQNSLIGVLTHFRFYLHALISAINKLYYQCVVDENDQYFLRFLWFQDNDPSKPVVHCRMTRLSFGLLFVRSAVLYCLEINPFR